MAHLLLLLAAVLFASHAQARPERPGQIPNGLLNRCSNCHLSAQGAGIRTPFGYDIEEAFLTPMFTVDWGPALAALDSDHDGRSNGQELQDPSGSWRPGQPQPGNPVLVTNPGVVDAPVRVPGSRAYALCALALGLARLSRTGSSRARSSARPRAPATPSGFAR